MEEINSSIFLTKILKFNIFCLTVRIFSKKHNASSCRKFNSQNKSTASDDNF